MAQTDSYARGGQPRSVPDTIAEAYARMVARQRDYNDLQDRGLPPPPTTSPTIEGCWGNIYSTPTTPDPELRRQQAEFKKVVDEVSKQNAWMAIPALAPVAAVGVLEAAAAMSGPMIGAAAGRGPLVLTAKEPYLRVGDNWATRAGRRAHNELAEKVTAKPGWASDPVIPLKSGSVGRPDVAAPTRSSSTGEELKEFFLELKPNTVSGIRAGKKALEKYADDMRKIRIIYYDPKDYM